MRDARNKYLVKMFPRKASLLARKDRLELRIEELTKQLEDLTAITDALTNVDRVVDGVAVQDLGDQLYTCSHTLDRGADIYKARGEGHRGYGLSTFNTFGHTNERWAGTGWKKKDAWAAALLWVTKGVRPVAR